MSMSFFLLIIDLGGSLNVFFKKMGQPWPLFIFIFILVKQHLYRKNSRPQWNSNLKIFILKQYFKVPGNNMFKNFWLDGIKIFFASIAYCYLLPTHYYDPTMTGKFGLPSLPTYHLSTPTYLIWGIRSWKMHLTWFRDVKNLKIAEAWWLMMPKLLIPFLSL